MRFTADSRRTAPQLLQEGLLLLAQWHSNVALERMSSQQAEKTVFKILSHDS